jgi:hypothetical protein
MHATEACLKSPGNECIGLTKENAGSIQKVNASIHLIHRTQIRCSDRESKADSKGGYLKMIFGINQLYC